MIKKGLILFSVLIYVFFAFSSYAQVQSGDITFEITPQYPKANEEVKAVLSSYTTDLNKARISWILNGQLSIESVGKKNFSFRVGDAGTQTSLEAQIQTSDGSFVNKQTIINPIDIDMLWEAQDSYVPPFYKGKALAPSEGIIKVVAMPNSITNEKYSYNWKQDDNNKLDSSGYGKNFYSFKNSYLEINNTIEASVSDLYGNNIGVGKTTIKTGLPKILFYEKDPITGIKWEKSLEDGFLMNSNGQTIVIEPYFFSPKNLNSNDLRIKWSLGGSEISTPIIKNTLSVKPESGQSGSSRIKVSVENIKRLFLSMDKELNVNF